MTAYTAYLTTDGLMAVRPPQGRNPEELKPFGGRKLRGTTDWIIPSRVSDLELMADAGIKVSVPEDWAAQVAEQDRLSRYLQGASDIQRAAKHHHWKTLMGHQRVGVAFLASRERALLAFTPGLGKSATSVLAADLIGAQRILVVAPLTLLPTWVREIKQWSVSSATQVPNGKALDPDARWTITNPEKLIAKNGDRFEQEWDLIIYDESILYKNRRAKRTKKAAELAKGAKAVWLLSGAPVSAYADDLYGQLHILDPEAFRSYWRFAAQWCSLEKTPWATTVVGNRDPEGLRDYLRDVMISRTPADCPGLLPETMQEIVSVDLNPVQRKLLAEIDAFTFTTAEGERHDITATIAQITRMAQAVSCPRILGHDDLGAKYDALLGLLKDEVLTGPVLAWTHYRETAEAYAEALTAKGYRVGLIYGGTPSDERERQLAAFQAKELDILLMQLQTGKFGLSLTEAGSMVYIDRSFSSDDWNQSVARIRRLSSKGRVVPTYILHGGATDNVVDVILNRKLESIHSLSLSDLKQILGRG